MIRKLARGLYDYPKVSPLLKGPLSPDIDSIAHALARRFRWRIVPSGHAANLLGLSTQVPAKAVYLTDGPSKVVKMGARGTRLQDDPPAGHGRHRRPGSAVVIQALKHLGKDAVTEDTVRELRNRLPRKARQNLLRDARYASDWIYKVAQNVANGEGE